MNFFQNRRVCRAFLGFLKGAGFSCLFLIACSAPTVKMKCMEIRMRLDHETLSDDQKGFLVQELKDCEQNLISAKKNDSTTMDGMERRLSPNNKSDEDSL